MAWGTTTAVAEGDNHAVPPCTTDWIFPRVTLDLSPVARPKNNFEVYVSKAKSRSVQKKLMHGAS